MAASFNLTGCSAVGSALRSGRRGRAFESPHPDQKPRKELDFSLLRGFCNFSRDRNKTAARIEVCLDHRDAPCTEMLYGPRTSTFCNPLRHNAMQNNPVRGPLKKAGTTNNDFLQVAESQLNTKFACSRSVVIRSLVILNAAVGGVKDLEHQILRFAQNDNAEKCSETTV